MTSRRTVERAGVSLSVTDHAGPGAPVVILHGLAGSSLEMEETARSLAPRRVLIPDARGHGASTRRPADVSRQAHVDDVVHVIEALAGEPVTLIGQSMGGHTALLVAAARPDLVERLILLEAGAGGDGTAESRIAMRAFFESWPRPFRDRAEAQAFLGDSALGRAWAADLREESGGLWPRFDVDVMIETIAAVDERPAWDEWARVTPPTLVVFAADGMFDDAARQALAGRRPDVVRVDLAAGSHDAHLDAFPQWSEAVRAFLADDGRRSA
ncbi:alpha/beta hydrolase [Frondihabitans peucedani]|uniref:alpha/beta fold hydrolase n=1 Tax=Frondihabitans peucedani TaxID=598626 RepID=UPI0031DCA518